MATYGTGEAAKLLGMYVEDVRRMVQNGKISATKVGRNFAIDGDALEAMILDRAGVRDAANVAGRIVQLEEEVAQLRTAMAGPHSPDARDKIRSVRAEWELEHGKRRRTAVSRRLRWLIFERDGHRCVYCGATPNDEVSLTIDHRIPVVDGGTNDPDNLVTACAECNAGKHALPLVEGFDAD